MWACPSCGREVTTENSMKRYKKCADCVRAQQAAAGRRRRMANGATPKIPKKRVYDQSGVLLYKECGHCKQLLDPSRFASTSSTIDKLNSACKDCVKAVWHKNVSEHRIDYILTRLKSKAKKIGVPFNLTIDDLVIPTHCPVLGIPLEFGKTDTAAWRDNSPSVDRVVPELGYVKGNVLIISYRANRIKNDATLPELNMLTQFYNTLTLSTE